MTMPRKLSAIILSLCLLGLATPTQAQNWGKNCLEKGVQITTYRVSKIKQGSSRADFDKAVALHLKWYRDHGYNDNNIVTAEPADFDPKVGRLVANPDEVITLHFSGPTVPAASHDAAWDAYVAAYKASSDIVTERRFCMPKTY
jgi:hypothetical protein